MPNVAADLRSMIRSGGFGEPCVVTSGPGEPRTVFATPGVADIDASGVCDAVVAGRSRSLTMASADVPELAEGDLIQWEGQACKVVGVTLSALGHVTTAFLQGMS